MRRTGFLIALVTLALFAMAADYQCKEAPGTGACINLKTGNGSDFQCGGGGGGGGGGLPTPDPYASIRSLPPQGASPNELGAYLKCAGGTPGACVPYFFAHKGFVLHRGQILDASIFHDRILDTYQWVSIQSGYAAPWSWVLSEQDQIYSWGNHVLNIPNQGCQQPGGCISCLDQPDCPSIHDVYMIGDTPADVDAAPANGYFHVFAGGFPDQVNNVSNFDTSWHHRIIQ